VSIATAPLAASSQISISAAVDLHVGRSVGLVSNYSSGSYYVGRITLSTEEFHSWRAQIVIVRNGTETTETSPVDLPQDVPLAGVLRFEVSQQSMKLFLNGSLLQTATISNPLAA